MISRSSHSLILTSTLQNSFVAKKGHRLNTGLTQAKIDVETHSVYCSYVNINLLLSEGLLSPSDMQQFIQRTVSYKVSVLAKLTFYVNP